MEVETQPETVVLEHTPPELLAMCTNKSFRKTVRKGSEFIYNLEEHTGEDGGIHKNGYLKLVNEDAEESVRRMASFVEGVGIDVDLTEPERLEDTFPGIDTTDISFEMLDTDAGSLTLTS